MQSLKSRSPEESFLMTEYPEPQSSSFKGIKTRKSKISDNFLKQYKKTNTESKQDNLSDISIRSSPKKVREFAHLAYAYSVECDTKILIASLLKKNLFKMTYLNNDNNFVKLSINCFKKQIINKLFILPATVESLNNVVRNTKATILYDYCKEGKDLDNGAKFLSTPREIKLYVEEDSLIYAKKYHESFSKALFDLLLQCEGSLCIESDKDLISEYELQKLAKNEDIKHILTQQSNCDMVCFRIYVNSVMPKMKDPVYLNFFNIPKHYLENIDLTENDLYILPLPLPLSI